MFDLYTHSESFSEFMRLFFPSCIKFLIVLTHKKTPNVKTNVEIERDIGLD
jgi:hypothetical protein